MRIRSIAFTASNLSLCEPLRGDRCTYSREAFPPVKASAARLLGQGRALGAIVFGGHTPAASGSRRLQLSHLWTTSSPPLILRLADGCYKMPLCEQPMSAAPS